MDKDFVIHTPLMWLDKAQTWELSDELGVLNYVRHNTLTCYNGVIGDGCGVSCLQVKSTWFTSLFRKQRSRVICYNKYIQV